MPNPQKNVYKKLLGVKGELTAKKYLKDKGYKILEVNYRTKFGEVDLIGLYADFLVFIEVKTRTEKYYGEPCEAVGFDKQRRYRLAAEYYMMTHRDLDLQPRFDVVEIFLDQINHIEDAFQ